MKSAEACLHPNGMFPTTAIRNRALTSGSHGEWRQRVPEENEEINFSFGNPGTDLLIAPCGPLRTAALTGPALLPPAFP